MNPRIFVLLLFYVPALFAEDIYIAQTQLGNGSGSSAANARAYTIFNDPTKWTANTGTDQLIGPGDTVHITGVINLTGSVANSTNQLYFQRGGTPGNPITLKFDAGGQLRHPTSFETGLIAGQGTGLHDIIIEGGNPGPVKTSTTQVDIFIFANGTNQANQVPLTRGMWFDNCGTNFTIKNLFVYGAYVREYGSTTDWNASQNLITLRGRGNLVVDNVMTQHGEGGIGLTGMSTVTTGLRVTNCNVQATSTGIKIGVVDNTANDGAVVTGNRVDGFGYWAGLPGNGHHCDGIQTIVRHENNQDQYNMTIAYNHIGPDLGTFGAMNGHIYLEHIHGCFIYNNLLTMNPTPISTDPDDTRFGKPPGVANGLIIGAGNSTHHASPTGIRSQIYNNTMITNGKGPAINTGFARVQGNIVINSDSFVSVWDRAADNALNGPYLIIDKNIYYSSINEYQFGVLGVGAGIFNWTTWRSTFGYDANSIIQTNPNPALATGILPSNSVAINFAPTQTLFSDDFYHNPRTGPTWDAGAVEFSTGGPVPPSVVSSSINAAGTQFAIVMSEAVAFGAGGNGGMSVTSAGGTVTLGTPSISGSTITWPITNRLIGQGESLTRTYTQPGNGIESTDDGQDLASFPALGITNSSTVSQVALPIFAPAPGGYSSTQNVTIALTPPGTPGATIRYTTNGTDPTSSSTLYAGAIPTSLSTTYKARAFAGGFLDSLVATGAYTIGDFVIGNAWTNVAVANQTGTFTWTFRATSSTSPNDAVLGLANKTVATYPDLAVIPRFASSGRIDAWNGAAGDYAAVNAFPYVAGQAYDFVVTVNIPAHTYSMTVVQAGGSTPTTIATNYTFRSSQATVPNLNNFGAIATAGGVTVSNMILSQVGTAISMTGISTNTAGTQVTVTFNSQPSFGTGGQGGFTLSASAGAVTASSPTIGTNSITWTTSRVIGRGETVSSTYVQPGNGIEAASGGSDLASFAGQSTVNNSTVDLTAPTPNPSTFGISPTALTSSTITMTATTSTDTGTPPVQYFFNEVSGNAGGSDSGWQSSPTFLDAGLAAGTQYRYRVQVRDSAVPPNVTTFSQEFSATTKSVAGAHPAMPFNMARANIVTP